ncbi:hypothetical protein [Alkalicoccobacillus murimartini]|uniref:DUF4340 domain-containing protein n=1 Tax=Alkalicoccobacillus murimartini TaxID=171685 RepID=A0ABT9YHM4_9BACI|nr:hypothetical protein [Alkalicoccobacillus murimartini]MDQ0207367.1 hypothetical protein [Alkalicoccobacillus murimartini]
MRQYKLGIAVLSLFIILILVIVGQAGYYVYDQVRVVTYEQVLEREHENLEEIEQVEFRISDSGDHRFVFEEDAELIQRLIEEPSEMGLQKTSGYTSELRYMIWFSPGSLWIDVSEEKILVGTDMYRVTNRNILFDLIQETEEDLEWEEI